MLFRPGMTRSGARQPGAVRSLNTHERQVFGPPTNDRSEPIADRDRLASSLQRLAGRTLQRVEHLGLGYIDGHVNLPKPWLS